jgi:hypothetical protein
MKKSSSNKWLTYHILVYSTATLILWFVAFSLLFGNSDASALTWFIMWSVTFKTHWVTDYFTSRWTKKLWAKKDVHNFFVVVGLDQLIHYTTLLITYKYLIN